MKWISVKERLPDKMGGYIVVNAKYGVVKHGYWHHGVQRFTTYNDDELTDITHWMPLPDPPEATDE